MVGVPEQNGLVNSRSWTVVFHRRRSYAPTARPHLYKSRLFVVEVREAIYLDRPSGSATYVVWRTSSGLPSLAKALHQMKRHATLRSDTTRVAMKVHVMTHSRPML